MAEDESTTDSMVASKIRVSESQLRRAAGSQSLSQLQEAIASGWTASEIAEMEGKSALHLAAWKGSLENLRYLVEEVGCDVNAYSRGEFSYGKTAIFFAATQSRPASVQYLLDQGAKVTIVNNKGQSVLSIAASHEMGPQIISQIQQLEQDVWWNFRESHSDGLEYGDLDPRFLDRPLRPQDVVTPLAINPTTKQSRKGGFAKRNPDVTKERQAKQRQPPLPKQSASARLTPQEVQQLQQSWQTLSAAMIDTSDTATSLLTIVTLGDKQRQPWIPETAQRLSTIASIEVWESTIQTTMTAHSSTPRQVELLQKLLSKLKLPQDQSTRNHPSPTPAKPTNTKPSLPYTPSLDSKLLEAACAMVDHLSIHPMLVQEDCPHLRLPTRPLFVNTTTQLVALKHRLEYCRLIAMDTEWYDKQGGATALSTLQISIVDWDSQTTPSYVIDLKDIPSEDYHTRVQQLIPWMLESETVTMLGFAVGHDLHLLEGFVERPIQIRSLMDLQGLLTQQQASLPGLKACVARYSPTVPLSKEQQCSEWGRRPLSTAQLDYAGLDASILLFLLKEWRHSNELPK